MWIKAINCYCLDLQLFWCGGCSCLWLIRRCCSKWSRGDCWPEQSPGFTVGLSVVTSLLWLMGFPGSSVVKNPPANEGGMALIPESGRSPREGNSSILAWKFHGQRTLVGYSPWGHNESDMNERLNNNNNNTMTNTSTQVRGMIL